MTVSNVGLSLKGPLSGWRWPVPLVHPVASAHGIVSEKKGTTAVAPAKRSVERSSCWGFEGKGVRGLLS